MDFDPAYLLLALIVGLLGMALMMFGKKMGDLRALVMGAVLSGETLFANTATSLSIAAGLTLVAYYAWRKFMPM